MRHFIGVVCFLLGLIALPSQGLAAKDPIGWALNQQFPNPVYTSSLYSVTYTFTNNLPLQLVKPLVIAKNASPATEFTYTDTCTGTRLLPNQSCTVQIQLDVLVAGEKFIQLSIEGYDNNVVPLPQLVTIATSTITGTVIGQPVNRLPNKMDANTSANYSFIFTNYGDIDADIKGVNVTQTTGTPSSTNTCTSHLKAGGGFCYVTGVFTPTSTTPASQTVTATLTYTGPTGSPAVTQSSTVINQATPNGPIVGSVVPGDSLPPLMTPGQVVTGVQFLFSNTSTNSYTFTDTPAVALSYSTDGIHYTTCNASSTPSCTSVIDNCISSLNVSPAACNVTLNFTAPGTAATTPPTQYTLKASLAYNNVTYSPATVTTSGTVVTTLPTTRTIQMLNNCPFAISYSLNGSSAPCTAGVTVTSPSGACFWPNYVGTSNVLAAHTGTDYVTIPANNIGGVQWSGNISAMTGCTNGTNCTQAVCGNNGVGNCAIGVGFNQPATQAEITMLTNAADTYDVEVINGYHIPISMEPFYYIDPSNAANDIQVNPNNYNCGTPGNFTATNGFGGCNWQLAAVPTTPSTSYYYLVGGGSGHPCSSCEAGEICGLSQPVPNAGVTGPLCGNFQGYWTPNELCIQSNQIPSVVSTGFNCTTKLPSQFNLSTDPYNNTYTSLMACYTAKGYTGPIYNSCYLASYSPPGSADQCCGCVDWWIPAQTPGATIAANSTSQTCPTGHTDSYWTNTIQANIQLGMQWLKAACPSVYVYPFDDATSKFSCTNNTASGANSTSYLITFCAGNSGAPAGANDGRTNPPIT